MLPEITDISFRTQSDIVILDIKGDLNRSSESRFWQIVDAIESSVPRAILINFREVGYINSTGIALIIGLLSRSRRAKRQLVAYGLTKHYQEIFNITQLSKHILLFPNENEALNRVLAGI